MSNNTGYTKRPGDFSLWKNDRKTDQKHPDYKGDGVSPDGEECWINAWVKETKTGKKFFSISIQRKGFDASQPQLESPPLQQQKLGLSQQQVEDDLPF